jgi:hypothetical protein
MIERVMAVVAVATVVGLVAACSQTAVLGRLGEFAGGLLGPRWPEGRSWDPDDATKLLTAITFAGLGGFWTLFYSYWLREKGAGMAAHMGRITSPITGRRVIIPRAGFVPEETVEGVTRWRQWRRYLAADNAVGVVGNLFTTLLCCLLAYALLFPAGRLPTEADPVGAQAEFFGSAWGRTGAALFLLLATAFLSDTWMTTIDAVSRVHTDVVYAYVPAARRLSQRRWYWIFVLLAGGITVVTLPYAQPGTMILFSSVVGFAGTVTFTICLLILNHRVLPRMLPAAYRPRRWAWIGIAVSVIAYACLAAAYGYAKFESMNRKPVVSAGLSWQASGDCGMMSDHRAESRKLPHGPHSPQPSLALSSATGEQSPVCPGVAGRLRSSHADSTRTRSTEPGGKPAVSWPTHG